ncbi:hypothetical protein C5613_26495 [Rhodococcus opacus]|uniref:Uncharacterized protein n=1 Tax=Rhodococcus opacus TaxID=37919 RepID=A0A2S8J2B3_RHOOP|nr:hypothetical protein C5613_26495 [Rhodococcus opacus]
MTEVSANSVPILQTAVVPGVGRTASISDRQHSDGLGVSATAVKPRRPTTPGTPIPATTYLAAGVAPPGGRR